MSSTRFNNNNFIVFRMLADYSCWALKRKIKVSIKIMVVKCEHGFKTSNNCFYYPTALRRVQITPKTTTKISRGICTPEDRLDRFPAVDQSVSWISRANKIYVIMLSPKRYFGKLLAVEVFSVTSQIDLFTDTAAILSCIVSYSYYGMLRVQSSMS